MDLTRRTNQISDRRLVAAVRAGDARAFEALYERHHPAILSFSRHLAGRLEDAEDAVQHTFLNAYRQITGSTAELDVKPWLFTVARNRCLSLLRARRLREGPAAAGLRTGTHDQPGEQPGAAWGTEGLSAEVERREELRALVADLGGLPEPQRAALVLSELEALSHAQIAKVLGVDTAKVRSLVFQARSSLISTREARDTPCGEIRLQLSTLRGPSLRRRTLRRHVRACAGCSEFEAAVRVQHRDLGLILPVAAGVGLREAAVPSAGTVGAASGAAGGAGGGVLATGTAAGGAALAGGGVATSTGGGIIGGLAAAVAGSGVAQLTAVVAVAAAASVGVIKTDLAQRLGASHGGMGGERLAGGSPGAVPAEAEPGAGAGPANSAATAGEAVGPGDGAGARDKGSGEKKQGGKPPGLAKKGGTMAPGLAKKDGAMPPGLANRGGGEGGARGGQGGTRGGEVSGRGTRPGAGAPAGKGAPSGRADGQGRPDSAGNGGQPAQRAPHGKPEQPGSRTPAGSAPEDGKPAKPAPAGQPADPGGPGAPGNAGSSGPPDGSGSGRPGGADPPGKPK